MRIVSMIGRLRAIEGAYQPRILDDDELAGVLR
jgi:hypothetical protein